MQPAVREFHLRFDPDGSRDLPPSDTIGHVREQSALAGTGLASEDDDSALSGGDVGKEAVEGLALGATADKLCRVNPGLSNQRRLPTLRT
jgi:hypothetical protein